MIVPRMNETTAMTRCTMKNAVGPPVGAHDLGSAEMLTINVGQITHDHTPKITRNQAIDGENRIAPAGVVGPVPLVVAGWSVCEDGVTGRVTVVVSAVAGVRSQSGLN